MSKTVTEGRLALNGPTMGTRWSVILAGGAPASRPALQEAFQAAVEEVDAQMSLWRPESALVALNRAPVGVWQEVPEALAFVLRLGLAIGRASGGAFDIAMGDAVAAWGFGPAPAEAAAIRLAAARARVPAWEAVEIEGARVRKRVPVMLDLNGIAKGYGVDRLFEVAAAQGLTSALAAIDGELRSLGTRPDGRPWAVGVEAPDPERRSSRSVVEIAGRAIATSGDYRHFVTAGGRRLSHTMDPRRGAPVEGRAASVTVLAPTCAEADAWATALLVLGPEAGAAMAERHGLDALWLSADKEAGAAPAATVATAGKCFAAGDGRG